MSIYPDWLGTSASSGGGVTEPDYLITKEIITFSSLPVDVVFSTESLEVIKEFITFTITIPEEV